MYIFHKRFWRPVIWTDFTLFCTKIKLLTLKSIATKFLKCSYMCLRLSKLPGKLQDMKSKLEDTAYKWFLSRCTIGFLVWNPMLSCMTGGKFSSFLNLTNKLYKPSKDSFQDLSSGHVGASTTVYRVKPPSTSDNIPQGCRFESWLVQFPQAPYYCA